MKKVFGFFFALVLGVSAFAQQTTDEKYVANMRKAMINLDSSWTNLQKMRETANLFERLANYKKDDWTPRYYQALCLIQLSWATANTEERKTILDATAASLKSAAELSPNNSEVVALEGYMYQAMIMINPMANGAVYGPKSAMTLQRAAELDPNNPRPHYLLGQNIYFTPPQWGGGEANARPHLEKALGLFKTFKPASEFAPNWGEYVCQMILDGKMK